MANIIEMPKLSDTMTVGTLLKWLKKEGDAVKSGDMLAEVETDKATMELESFFDGTLLKIFAPDGSQVELGAPLCAIGKPGEKIEAPAGKPAATGSAPAATEKGTETGDKNPEATKSGDSKAEPAPQDKEKAGASTGAKNEVQGQPAAPTPQAGETAKSPPAKSGEAVPAPVDGERIRISPLARKLAAEKGVDAS